MFSSLLAIALVSATVSHPGTDVPHACAFGLVHPGGGATCTVELSNTSSQRLEVSRLRTPVDGLTVAGLPIELPAHGTAKVHLDWHAGSKLGRREFVARLLTTGNDESVSRSFAVRGTGFVYSFLNHPVASADLGSTAVEGTVPRVLEFETDDVPDFRLTGVVSKPDFVHVEISKSGKKAALSVAPASEWGLQEGKLVLATNMAEEPRVELKVNADVLGAVRPRENPLALGSLRTDKDNVIAVPLTSMNGRPFKVGKITLDRIAGKVSVGKCVNSRPGCRLIRLELSKDQPTGNLGSQMHIVLPDYHKTLTVGFWGVLLKPDTKIVDLNKAQDESEEGAKSSVEDRPVDFGKALKKSSSPPSPPPADPPGEGPVLRWSVANEQPLYGYLIYRSEHKDGPWRRVNDKIVPVLGHDDAISEYAWRDTSAVKGKTYWYFIKTLANNGTKKKLTGAQKVVAH